VVDSHHNFKKLYGFSYSVKITSINQQQQWLKKKKIKTKNQ
jgi:hypothetical protein